MKKIFAFILAAAMLLSLCACSNPEDEAFEAGCALLEEGRYEEALEVFGQIESYTRVAEKVDIAIAALEEAYLQQMEAEQADRLSVVLGAWKEIRNGLTLYFDEEMGCEIDYKMSADERGNSFSLYNEMDGQFTISYLPYVDMTGYEDTGLPMEFVDVDGVTHLRIGHYDFVREEDYAPFEPYAVDITLANWEEYFEIVEGPLWDYNDFNEVVGVRWCTALCVKEEYADRVRTDMTNLIFQHQSYFCQRTYTADLNTQELELGDITWKHTEAEVGTFFLFDMDTYYMFRGVDVSHPTNPASQKLSENQVYASNYRSGDAAYIVTMDDFTITRVEGTLWLSPV